MLKTLVLGISLATMVNTATAMQENPFDNQVKVVDQNLVQTWFEAANQGDTQKTIQMKQANLVF